MEAQWKSLLDKLRDTEMKFVPSKMVDINTEVHRDKSTVEVARKNIGYLETRDRVNYKEYTRQRSKVRAISTKLQKDAEMSIAKDAKIEFQDKIKSEADDGKNILMKKDGDKTKAISDFSSVFNH